jgi:diguanylate cyclase (GGDEF)-like protein
MTGNANATQGVLLSMALAAGRMGTWLLNMPTNRWYWSERARELMHAPHLPRTLTTSEMLALTHGADRGSLDAAIHDVARRADGVSATFRLAHAPERWLELKGEFLADQDRDCERMAGILLDVTRRRAANDVLRHHAVVLDNLLEGIALLADHGAFERVNPALVVLLGHPARSLVGQNWLQQFPASERPALTDALARARSAGRCRVECVLALPGRLAVPVECTIIRDRSETVTCFHLLVRDLRERRATVRFEYLALHDQLTGLPNRRALLDRLEHALKASPGRPVKLALLLFDLDGFKQINDRLGHHAGDAVLTEVSARMSRAVRPSDTLARLGGDEFVLMAPGIDTLAQAQSVASRFHSETAHPLSVAGQQLSIKFSVGIALAEAQGTSPEDLLERADRSMYAAKHENSQACVH